MLEKAIAYSDEASTDNKNAFIVAYDTVTKQKMIKWNITMGLYWARPYTFINLDSTNRAFITDVDNMPHYFTSIVRQVHIAALHKEQQQIAEAVEKAERGDDG